MKIINSIIAAGTINPGDIGLTNPITNADATVVSVLTAVYAWAGILAVIVIIIAGFLFTTSDGNATRTKRARDAIMGAVIGLVVIVMAFTITQYVAGRF